MTTANAPRIATRPVPQTGAHERVTGRLAYASDLVRPGMLHAKLLRSPHAHARITGIDAGAARALPGVRAVATGADLDGLNPTYGVRIKDQPVLGLGKVRYRGDVVAVVAADDEATALRALERIAVDYAPLPPLMTIEAALAPGAPLLFEEPQPAAQAVRGEGALSLNEPEPNVLCAFHLDRGDADAALAGCDRVFEDTFRFSRMSHFHLEPSVALAEWGPDGRVELWTGNQDPFLIRQDIAHVFRLPEDRVRVHSGILGGGFGAKSYCKHEPVAALLARMTGRPVRLALTLEESLATLSQHGARITLRTGVMNDGTLVAQEARVDLDAGAYADGSAIVCDKTGYRGMGPYRWRARKVRCRAVRTSTVPAGSFRGFGGNQMSFASECQVDRIAARLGLDPLDLRRKNLLRPGEPYMPGETGMDSDLVAGLEEAARRAGHDPDTPPGPNRGFGFAVGFKDGGGEARASQAMVKVTQDGRAIVQAGVVEMGQGAMTALRQVAAEALGLPLDAVTYAAIDTDATPYDQGTHASSGMVLTGRAVERAALDVRRQVLDLAADLSGCPASALDLRDWTVHGPGLTRPVADLCRAFYGPLGWEFVGRGVFKAPADPSLPLGSARLFYMPAFAAALVEVDPETGRVEVLSLAVGSDAGRAVNPAAALGQNDGGAVQGYGQALFERLIFDDQGIVNATPWSYRVPLASDLPGRYEGFVAEHGLGPGPFGAKGIGEASITAVAPAIANAAAAACGARVDALPLIPERVLKALAAATGEDRAAGAPAG